MTKTIDRRSVYGTNDFSFTLSTNSAGIPPMTPDPTLRHALFVTLLALCISFAGCGSGSDGAADTVPEAVGPAPAATVTSGDNRPATDQRSVDAESLPYAEIDDTLVYGHFAFPSDMIEPLPAIVVVHDWWGLNENALNDARRLAAEGYMVLAIDLYDGEVVSNVTSARAKMISVVEHPKNVESNLHQALEFVRIAGAPQVATLGWGLGGRWALDAAVMFPDQVDAAVLYYGQVSDDEDRLAGVDGPVLGIFGDRDRGIKIDTVRRFEAAMQRLRKDLTLVVYEGVGHGFADPARTNYRSDITEDAWQRTTDFLAANLSGADES